MPSQYPVVLLHVDFDAFQPEGYRRLFAATEAGEELLEVPRTAPKDCSLDELRRGFKKDFEHLCAELRKTNISEVRREGVTIKQFYADLDVPPKDRDSNLKRPN